AIVIYTEPGGRMEAELARWVTENNSRLPIVAFMAGRFMDEMPGMSFGQAGRGLPGRHLRPERGRHAAHRRGEPRRVRALRALHQRHPIGDGRGAQALLGREPPSLSAEAAQPPRWTDRRTSV